MRFQVPNPVSTTKFIGHLVYFMFESWYEKESKENKREEKRRGWGINSNFPLLC